MKLLKFSAVILLFSIMYSCSGDVTNEVGQEEAVFNLEQRDRGEQRNQRQTDGDCVCCQYASLLGIFQYYVEIGMDGFTNPVERISESFENLQCAIEACNGGFPLDCSSYEDSGICSNEPVNGEGTCPGYTNFILCYLSCNVNNYVENPSKVGLINIQTALCSYIDGLEACGLIDRYNDNCGYYEPYKFDRDNFNCD